jgi:hypothetical protein
MTGLGVEKIRIDVPLSEESYTRLLPCYSPFRRGETKAFEFQFLMQLLLFQRQAPSVLCTVQLQNHLLGHCQLQADAAHILLAPTLQRSDGVAKFYIQRSAGIYTLSRVAPAFLYRLKIARHLRPYVFKYEPFLERGTDVCVKQ